MSKRAAAEVFGTFTLVLVTAGPIAIGGFDPAEPIGRVGLAFANGFGIAAMIVMVGPISGAHINPAVTLGFAVAGRFPRHGVFSQIAAQLSGSLLGAGVVYVLASAAPETVASNHMGATGWRWDTAWPWWAAFVAEATATFVFVCVFLTIRRETRNPPLDGLAIGVTATALDLTFVSVSGASLNPARSFGPAVAAGSAALDQLWLYIVAPLIGAVFAGCASRVILPQYPETSEMPVEASPRDNAQP